MPVQNKIVNRIVMKDNDRDGYPNKYDCRPNNPGRDVSGVIHHKFVTYSKDYNYSPPRVEKRPDTTDCGSSSKNSNKTEDWSKVTCKLCLKQNEPGGLLSSPKSNKYVQYKRDGSIHYNLRKPENRTSVMNYKGYKIEIIGKFMGPEEFDLLAEHPGFYYEGKVYQGNNIIFNIRKMDTEQGRKHEVISAAKNFINKQ
jgi:hypothetical protein